MLAFYIFAFLCDFVFSVFSILAAGCKSELNSCSCLIRDYVSELSEQFRQWRRHGICCAYIPLLPDDNRLSVADVYFSDTGFLCCVSQHIPRVSVIPEHCHCTQYGLLGRNLSVTVKVTHTYT